MIEVRLLGQFEVLLDGEPVELTARPAQSLFAYLVLNPVASLLRLVESLVTMLIKIARARADGDLAAALKAGHDAGRKYINIASQVLSGK